jgi:hypothetical protein
MGDVTDVLLVPQESVPVLQAAPAPVPPVAAPAPAETAASVVAPDPEDVVGALTDALRRSDALPPTSPGRPLDVQYWACWLALALTTALSTALVVLG